MSSRPPSNSHPGLYPNEIQNQIQKGYIKRLDQRLKKMREAYANRDWKSLRSDCIHIRTTAPGFGFPALSDMAAHIESTIPEGETSRSSMISQLRQPVEDLFSMLEKIIIHSETGGAD